MGRGATLGFLAGGRALSTCRPHALDDEVSGCSLTRTHSSQVSCLGIASPAQETPCVGQCPQQGRAPPPLPQGQT